MLAIEISHTTQLTAALCMQELFAACGELKKSGVIFSTA